MTTCIFKFRVPGALSDNESGFIFFWVGNFFPVAYILLDASRELFDEMDPSSCPLDHDTQLAHHGEALFLYPYNFNAAPNLDDVLGSNVCSSQKKTFNASMLLFRFVQDTHGTVHM